MPNWNIYDHLRVKGHRPWIDPTHPDYGADPTGVTESTTAIQAALTAAGAISPSAAKVQLPIGDFLMGNLVIPQYVTLQGMGRGTRLLAKSGLTGPMLAASGASPVYRIQIRDLLLDGENAAAGSNHCIDVDNMFDALIENVVVYNARGTGIYGDSGFEMVKILSCRVQTCVGRGIYLQAGDLNVLFNNAILQSGAEGIALVDANSSQVILNNTDSNAGNGYSLSVIENMIVIGNWSYNDCVSAGNASFEISPPFTNGTMKGNFALNANRTAFRLGTLAGPSQDITGLTFEGNVAVDTNASYNALLADGTGALIDSVIANNVLVDNTNKASVTATLTRTRVSSNPGYTTENSGTGTIASGATTAVVTHGLSVTPTLDDISIVFGEQGTSDYGRWWVSTITSTQFTLNVSAVPGASNLDFAWRAVVL